MKLPAFTTVSNETLDALRDRHGPVITGHFEQLRDVGIFNAVYCLGNDYILRIPRNHSAHGQALYRETVAVPAVRRAGVRTPPLIVFDDSCDLLPVPYAIYERVPGQVLASLQLEPMQAADVWRELGRDLARVHTIFPTTSVCRRRNWFQIPANRSRRDARMAGSLHRKLAGCVCG